MNDLAVVATVTAASAAAALSGCASRIYCTGQLLDTIQSAKLFNDSKTFVDMPLRAPEGVVLAAFATLLQQYPSPSREQLATFVARYFYPAGSDIEAMSPVDWNPSPSFLNGIVDPSLRGFAASIHKKWQDLTRRFNPGMASSYISVANPFVVAGGRFREYYYWFAPSSTP
jgi:alpha,alpha-trehalase